VIGIYDQVIAIPMNRGTDRVTRSFLFGVVNVEIKSNRFCGIVPIQADIFLQGYLEFRFRVRERFAGHRLRAQSNATKIAIDKFTVFIVGYLSSAFGNEPLKNPSRLSTANRSFRPRSICIYGTVVPKPGIRHRHIGLEIVVVPPGPVITC